MAPRVRLSAYGLHRQTRTIQVEIWAVGLLGLRPRCTVSAPEGERQ